MARHDGNAQPGHGALAALALCAILAIVAAGCGGRGQETAAREKLLIARIDSLSEQARLTVGLRDSLQVAISNWEASAARGLSQPDLEYLKKRGLGDPVVELLDNLERHPEVFPVNVPPKPWVYRPDRERTIILSRDWVYVVLSDGHYEREALLEYEVEGPGQISWKCLTLK